MTPNQARELLDAKRTSDIALDFAESNESPQSIERAQQMERRYNSIALNILIAELLERAIELAK